MSAARGRDRRGLSGRSHLVLVRGGVDHDGEGPDDADWRAFCERIGWQHVETELPDDYEERLAARIFRDQRQGQGEDDLDDPVTLGVARALRAARISAIRRLLDEAEDDGPISGTVPSLRPAAPAHRLPAGPMPYALSMGETPKLPPQAFKAAAPLAVAAALFVVASAVLWRAARPSVDAVARPDTATAPGPDADAAPRATIAPVVDRALLLDPSDQRPDPAPRARPLRSREAPMRAVPSETKPQKPITPGSRVALRERRDDVRPRGGSRLEPPMLPAGSLARSAMGSSSRLPMTMTGGNPHPPPQVIARPEDVAIASALPVIPHAWPAGDPPYPAASHVSDAWTRPASFAEGPARATLASATPAGATWSLSPGNPRWYGVGLPPSTPSIGVPPGVGVMAQLDLGKAIEAR
jgi:hypothetical protein